ncbi:transcriptional regulator [Mycobacterium decipiens]|uniref:Transcriptional regulator n=2 Tax=Mycobacterium decipiens TaxID=1430326 RepID=A0A1X2LU92_9MYCO|nr:metalloregulator ArsR/SmtB family transcription factor [Mycobacterium decipiens]OSC40539.1 transcriptional regulator [Mycobacterium decipiens]
MKATGGIDRPTAERWASWFRALGDPTRVLILHQLANATAPMTVGELTQRLDVGQSTISHHLAKLADVRFVLVDQRGTSSLWRINTNCLACFPSAVDVVMGRIPVEFVSEQECTR